ncbi:MAG: hypothetical protein AAFQ78_02890, partial [Bacteroidota bacterium]
MQQRLLRIVLLLGMLLGPVAAAHAHPKAARRYLKQLKKSTQPNLSSAEAERNAQNCFVNGVTALLLNKPQQAYTALKRALQLAPLNAAIHFKMAQLLQQYPQ